MGTDVVDRENAGMVDRTGRAGLLLEAAKTIEVAAKGSGQHLDRNFAAQTRVAGTVHLTHAARAQRRDDLVGPEFCAGSQGHNRMRLYRLGSGDQMSNGCHASIETHRRIEERARLVALCGFATLTSVVGRWPLVVGQLPLDVGVGIHHGSRSVEWPTTIGQRPTAAVHAQTRPAKDRRCLPVTEFI